MSGAIPQAIHRRSLPELGDALEFLRVIWGLDHALQRASRRMEKLTGVTSQQRLVIRIVGRFPGIPAGMLARLLHVHPGALTGMLKRLERQGLIRRRSDPRDGRRSLVGLTERGRVFNEQGLGLVEAAVARIIETTSAAHLEAARAVLESLEGILSRKLATP